MLKLEEVKKNYHHDKGLKQANLKVEDGKLYLFVGQNGSGKSTTIKLIAKVIFNKKGEGFLTNEFQKMVYLPDKRTYPKLLKVSTYLAYYLNTLKNRKIILDSLFRYQLPDKAIGGLSKGMLQKVGILQTILCDGDLYLFDEPTDGLDTASISTFKEDLKTLLEQNKTIIISTHNKAIYKDLKPICYTFKEGVCNEKK